MNQYQSNNDIGYWMFFTALYAFFILVACLSLSQDNELYSVLVGLASVYIGYSLFVWSTRKPGTFLLYQSGQWYWAESSHGELVQGQVLASSYCSTWLVLIDFKIDEQHAEPKKMFGLPIRKKRLLFIRFLQNDALFKRLIRQLKAHQFYRRKGKRPLSSLDIR